MHSETPSCAAACRTVNKAGSAVPATGNGGTPVVGSIMGGMFVTAVVLGGLRFSRGASLALLAFANFAVDEHIVGALCFGESVLEHAFRRVDLC